MNGTAPCSGFVIAEEPQFGLRAAMAPSVEKATPVVRPHSPSDPASLGRSRDVDVRTAQSFHERFIEEVLEVRASRVHTEEPGPSELPAERKNMSTAAIAILVLALILGGVGLFVEALRWVLIIAVVLLIASFFTGRTRAV